MGAHTYDVILEENTQRFGIISRTLKSETHAIGFPQTYVMVVFLSSLSANQADVMLLRERDVTNIALPANLGPVLRAAVFNCVCVIETE